MGGTAHGQLCLSHYHDHRCPVLPYPPSNIACSADGYGPEISTNLQTNFHQGLHESHGLVSGNIVDMFVQRRTPTIHGY